MRDFTPVPDVERIAVVRANGLGDYVFSTPALDALRAAYPDAEIVLLGKPWHAEFLQNRPGPINRVEVIPPCPGVGEDPNSQPDAKGLARFFKRMAGERFDLALQLHGGGRYSNPFTRRLGARVTVGLKTPDAEPLDRNVAYVYFQPEYLRWLEVAASAGAKPLHLEPYIAVTESDRAEARTVLPPDDRPLAVIHPGATDARRYWPSEKFAAVGDALTKAGARVALNGTAPERPLVDAVAAAMRYPAIDLCGRLSLAGLVGVLSQARVVVSNDSGPLHLATAVGASTVGIFWCGNLIIAGPTTRDRHRPAISWRLNCPVCGVNTLEAQCAHKASFVADVPLDEVITSALDLFAAARTASGPDESR